MRVERPCVECGATRRVHTWAKSERCRRCAAKNASQSAANRLLAKTFAERIASHVVTDENGCEVWTGYRYSNGYSGISWNGTQVLGHRLSYEQRVGPIPDGLVIDHLCRNKACINPAHLEPVTSGENTRRAMRTHCVNGHEFTPQNVYRPGDGKRYCRECRRRRVREYQQRRRAAA